VQVIILSQALDPEKEMSMKTKKQEVAESTAPKARVPFFVRGIDPESLRGVRGGDDLDMLRENDNKRNG
jgi:hypothetical protein